MIPHLGLIKSREFYVTSSGQIPNGGHWIQHSTSPCLQPLGPWGDALGPDTWATRGAFFTGLLLASPMAHKCSQQVEGGSQGLDCPSPLSAGKLSEITFVLRRKSTKPAPGRNGHRDSWSVGDSAGKTKKQDTGVIPTPSLFHASRVPCSTLLSLPGLFPSDNQLIVSIEANPSLE